MAERNGNGRLTNAAIVVGFVLNLSAVVWGAAKIDSAVERLDERTMEDRQEFRSFKSDATRQLNDHETRIRIIERAEAKKP